jgi:hypothetical protein
MRKGSCGLGPVAFLRSSAASVGSTKRGSSTGERGGLFGQDKRVGRVDEEGIVYRGKGGLFGTEHRIGRVDPDGTVYLGRGGLWGSERVVGFVEPPNVLASGAALLLLFL